MKKFQRWMGVLLVAFAASSLFVACGDDDESCLVNSDCYDEELCNQATGLCAIDCTNDPGVCEGDETCQPLSGADGSICVASDTTEPECTVDTDCDTENGETCDTGVGVCVGGDVGECTTEEDCDGDDICVDSVCESPDEVPHFFAQVVDTTTNEAACEKSDPGSDIFGIILTKADDTMVYATAINADIKDRTNDQPNTRNDFFSVLDGTAPALTDGCSDFQDTFSMGCGGNVVVEFVEEDGTRYTIDDSDSITVLEYGGQCSTGDDADSWSVYVCDADSSRNDIVGDTDGCKSPIHQGDGIGESNVTVSL